MLRKRAGGFYLLWFGVGPLSLRLSRALHSSDKVGKDPLGRNLNLVTCCFFVLLLLLFFIKLIKKKYFDKLN